ncbi:MULTISPECIES: metal ABC transporter substrate-binding protein [unclassified Clostridium]|uniref:metal ABC transporter substrate-binding protein n=1 Tax=unclassified Clostridium TaxID=2614128 RepID=UPI00189A5B4F|nr:MULTISPECIES: metal ABC transporter substrate-binding protein [unclassified Clostridium]MBP3914937.1 zinc ABC transporter substrate-binding protein [Clostridium sp.]MEE0933133.1 metal ABC transporter substrate-binding protein [Clostridium sp.]
MKFKFSKLLILLITTSLLFIGCNNNTNSNKTTDDDTLNIVTSFYPLYISTINITKDIPNVSVTNMTKSQTGCLHDYQLTPQDLKTLENADILVVNGAGMESFLDSIISQYPDLQIINATEGLDLLEDDTHSHDDHEHDDEDEHAEDHDHEHEYNAHVWVSVTGNIDEVKNISSQLEVLDPENKTAYEANTNTYVSKLEDLKNEMHVELDNLPNKDIITFHEAFPYFAEEFNLNIAGVIEIEPDSEPSAKEIEEIINTIKTKNIKALFTEPQYSSKIAETIATETGATVYELDPIVTGDANPDAYDDYINKMKKNLDVLKEALK